MVKLFLEDLEPGLVFTSPGRTVTESDVVSFAGLSGDFNPVHTDEVLASSLFGGRIAHGLLILAMSSGLGQRFDDRVQTVALLEVNEWKFGKPVFLGDTIHLRSTVVACRRTSQPGRGIVQWRREILNQAEEVVQTGLITTMVRTRPEGGNQ